MEGFMKRRDSFGIIGGLVLILIGIYIVGRAFDIITFSIFFDGWWTLFIIVPCFVGLLNHPKEKTGYLIGLGVGTVLLLNAQDFVSWRMVGPLLLAGIFVLIGLKMLFGGKEKKTVYEERTDRTVEAERENAEYYTGQTYHEDEINRMKEKYTESSGEAGGAEFGGTGSAGGAEFGGTGSAGGAGGTRFSNTYRNSASMDDGFCACSAILNGRNIRFDNEVFRGAMLSSLMGGIEIDLRNAVVQEDVTIEAKVLMGGIEIYVPRYVRVKVTGTIIMGGVDNKWVMPYDVDPHMPTLSIHVTGAMGGVDII